MVTSASAMGRLLTVWCTLLVVGSVIAENCPGDKVRCPDFMTCCKLPGGDYGCCPFPDAKCCADGIHCCPHNMECDVSHQTCTRNGSPAQFYWRVPIHPEIVEPVEAEEELVYQQEEDNALQKSVGKENKCPDATVCHSAFTCCKMYSGKYGCCPFDNGTCCQDGFHCCPHGSQCSATGECSSAEFGYTIGSYRLKDKKYDQLIKTQKTQIKPAHQDVSDPGGRCLDGRICPEKYTCCRIEGERFGCCPYTDARCCDDGIHCCPKGTNCNITLGTCDIQKNFGRFSPVQPMTVFQWSDDQEVAVESNRIDVDASDVICPDQHYQCPTGTTCCMLASGAYGCCPMEKATCCSDKEHCCPYGYECVTEGCRKGNNFLPPFLRTAASMRFPQDTEIKSKTVMEVPGEVDSAADVICPDQYECPDHNTCCQLESGEYGCCPMEMATCCPDKIHCCPHGYRCITDGCRKNPGFSWALPQFLNAITVVRDSKPSPQEVPGDICPDHKTLCPEDNTCCDIGEGNYGCCPLKDATCCGDEATCCPHGYWCTDEGCDRMPGTPLHPEPFLHILTGSRKVNHALLP